MPTRNPSGKRPGAGPKPVSNHIDYPANFFKPLKNNSTMWGKVKSTVKKVKKNW